MQNSDQIPQWLTYLKLPWMLHNYPDLLAQASKKHTSHQEFLTELCRGEYQSRQERSLARRIQAAGFPVAKTFDSFNWNWPNKIDRALLEHLAQADFVKNASNVVLLGPVGVGKTHLATALAMAAAQKGYNVLFTNTIKAVNTLLAANKTARLNEQLKKYTKPHLLVLDELGYLPIDDLGANMLFQIFSQRYEQVSTIVTTNKAFKDWASIFNNNATTASAVLDRLLHHCDAIAIDASSYRMKNHNP